jgi:hypothetical protein
VFFENLVTTHILASWYEFENSQGIFPEVHRQMRFCLLTIVGRDSATEFTQTASELISPDQINDPERRVALRFTDFSLFNPNTLTASKFRFARDYEIAHRVYSDCPPLIRERLPLQNPWHVEIRRMVNMADDSSYFRTAKQLDARGLARDEKGCYVGNGEIYLRLYESKMLYHFDHRFGTFEGISETSLRAGYCRDLSVSEQQDPRLVAIPRYWIEREVVKKKVNAISGERDWLLAYRDITNVTNERTVICAVLPKIPVGHTAFLIKSTQGAHLIPCLLANLNSLEFDYFARQKISSTHLSQFILKQLPVLPPDRYTLDLLAFIVPRVLELTYTAWDIKAFADDVWREVDKTLQAAIMQAWEANVAATGGHVGAQPPAWTPSPSEGEGRGEGEFPHPPFKWDDERRAHLRAELDALYGHLYGLTREELDYILDTFPIVRRKDEERWGEYRTKRLVLEYYDRLEGQFV